MRIIEEKKEKWPYGFLCTSSHDTKRSEDVRMRLHVLSEIPDKWSLEVRKWSLINSKHKHGNFDPNIEYYIYQTLLGVWPALPLKKAVYHEFCERIWKVILKSLREAKQETGWMYPDVQFEEKIQNFLFIILSNNSKNHFLKEFLVFHKMIHRFGAWNSLSQTVIKMGSPGVVDIYQGNELLNFKLVDPDNRSSVNFDQCRKILFQLRKIHLSDLFARQDYAKAKFSLQLQALQFRAKNRELFLLGEYIPLKAKGVCKENVIAFLRKNEEKGVVILSARFFSKLVTSEWNTPLGRHAWGDTEVILPSEWRIDYLVDLFTQKKIKVKKRGGGVSLLLSQAFEFLPFCFLSLPDDI